MILRYKHLYLSIKSGKNNANLPQDNTLVLSTTMAMQQSLKKILRAVPEI